MIRRAHMGIVALLIAIPGAAQSWRAMNGHEVQPLGDGVYEVVGRVGSGASDYWCGIGDYARVVLDLPGVQRIYVWRPVGPSVTRSGRKAVHFALTSPPGAKAKAKNDYSLTVRRTGENLSAVMARQYCYDSRFDEFPWRGWP